MSILSWGEPSACAPPAGSTGRVLTRPPPRRPLEAGAAAEHGHGVGPAWVPSPAGPAGAAGSGAGGCVSDHRSLLNTTIKECSQEVEPGIKP